MLWTLYDTHYNLTICTSVQCEFRYNVGSSQLNNFPALTTVNAHVNENAISQTSAVTLTPHKITRFTAIALWSLLALVRWVTSMWKLLAKMQPSITAINYTRQLKIKTDIPSQHFHTDRISWTASGSSFSQGSSHTPLEQNPAAASHHCHDRLDSLTLVVEAHVDVEVHHLAAYHHRQVHHALAHLHVVAVARLHALVALAVHTFHRN